MTAGEVGERFFDDMESYFQETLATHGASPRGVDWNSPEAQTARFQQILKICDRSRPFSINDYGCGYGALADYLIEQDLEFSYTGLDVNPDMIGLAHERNPDSGRCSFVSNEADLQPADYTVASGLFNLRLDVDEDTWRAYVLTTLDSISGLSTRGFSFNMLTMYSDASHMRDDLYYGNPGFFFDHCKRNYSRNVALLHDYDLYEYTILVRMGD